MIEGTWARERRLLQAKNMIPFCVPKTGAGQILFERGNQSSLKGRGPGSPTSAQKQAEKLRGACLIMERLHREGLHVKKAQLCTGVGFFFFPSRLTQRQAQK